MHKPIITKITSCLLGLFLIMGCDLSRQTVKDPEGNIIPIPECKDYISRFTTVGLMWDILDKYKGEIAISTEIRNNLKDLQQHYVLQARELCEKAGTFIASGEKQQYFCRYERLSNSVMQLEMINRTLEGIKNSEDAKNESVNINDLLKDYNDRFFMQFNKPCSLPPQPKIGKFEIANTEYVGTDRLVIFTDSDILKQISIINAGEASITWWLENFPWPPFYSSIEIGKTITTESKRSHHFDIVRTIYPTQKNLSYPFKISSDTGQKAEIKIKVVDNPGPYENARTDFIKTLQTLLNNTLKTGASLVDEKDLALKAAELTIREKLPNTSESIQNFIAGQLLFTAGQYESAIKAYEMAELLEPELANIPQNKYFLGIAFYFAGYYNKAATQFAHIGEFLTQNKEARSYASEFGIPDILLAGFTVPTFVSAQFPPKKEDYPDDLLLAKVSWERILHGMLKRNITTPTDIKSASESVGWVIELGTDEDIEGHKVKVINIPIAKQKAEYFSKLRNSEGKQVELTGNIVRLPPPKGAVKEDVKAIETLTIMRIVSIKNIETNQ